MTEKEVEAAPTATDHGDIDEGSANFSRLTKSRIILISVFCSFNASLGTSMPSGAYEAISEYFSVSNKMQLALLNSLNLVGFILGPILFGPLSEYIGRRPVMIATYFGYFVFTLACSAAPNYPVLLAFRLLCGINGAAPFTIVGAIFSDILDDPYKRGVSIALYMFMNTSGALIGPIVSGYASRLSWRWAFWAASIMAAPGVLLVLTLPETFAPVLRNKRARQGFKEGTSAKETSEAERNPFEPRKIFLRPVTLAVTEPILLLSALYLALAYSIFYFMFQAYPIVFQDMYHLPPSTAALAYLPVIIGALLSTFVFLAYSSWYDTSAKRGKPWAQRKIYRRLPIACLAAPCMVIGMFWLGWTASDSNSPILPSVAGLFVGAGFQLIFLAMLNYITDTFREHSASAHAAAGCIRSLCAILVPLAADPMYKNLGIHWAPSLLGFISLAMGVIPFLFMIFGDKMAHKSAYQ